MPLRGAVAVASLAAMAVCAAPASAGAFSSRLSISGEADRTCTTRVLSGEGVSRRSLTAPSSGWVTARLLGRATGSGDWDLGVFGAGGRVVAGSASFGMAEVAQGMVYRGERITVQACRRSGDSRRASLTVDFAGAKGGGNAEKSSLVSVSTPSPRRERELQALGLDLTEHGEKRSTDVVLHGSDDAAKLRKAGFSFVERIDDLAKQSAADRAADARYAERVRASALPSQRTTYRTLADYGNEMKTLADQNPNLVKRITLPFKTYEGRPVEGIEITSKVNALDGKPVFLQMGVHHAREWPSGEHAIEWAYELVNGYKANNARVRDLVNRTRTIVVPIVNPDGFNISRTAGGVTNGRGNPPGSPPPPEDCKTTLGEPFNQEVSCESANVLTTPTGEYRRKNCRFADDSNGGSCAQPTVGRASPGVDPNRNYGGFWGGPGADASRTGETYRGPGPFSEPETRNVRDLVSKRQVTTLITNHTFSNLVLRPPGIRSLGETPDEPIYKALGDAMAAENGYSSQFSYQLYDTTGTTEDWTYYATGGLGYTFEIGRYNFHPPYQQVVDEYEGTSYFADAGGRDGKGNREAYFKALESTADASKHSVLAGAAPSGSILRVKKSFKTRTSRVQDANGNEGERIEFDDTLETTTEVPGSGRLDWHINQSTRPVVQKDMGRPITGPTSDPISFTGGASPVDAKPCGNANTEDPTCFNDHTFTIEAGKDNAAAVVKVDWETPASDWDMIVFVDSDNNGSSVGETQVVGKSQTGPGDFEQVTIPGSDLIAGRQFVVRVTNFAAVESYNGTVAFKAPEPFEPARTETWRLTCESFSGTVLTSQDVLIGRGERKNPGLQACTAAFKRAFATGRGCDRPTGRARRTTLDRAKLGRDRVRHLRSFKIGRRGRSSIDKFCFTDRRQIRIGYPSGKLRKKLGSRNRRRYTSNKAVLVLTSSKKFKIRGVRVGSSTRTLRRRIGRLRGVKVGRNTWYAKRGSKSRLVFKVRGRKVYEIGIADRGLNRTRASQRRFFDSFR